MLDFEVSLARGVLLHDSRHIGESAGRQAHSGAAHEGSSHNQQVRVRFVHRFADIADEGQDDEGGDGVGDESGDDEGEGGEDEQDAVEVEAVDLAGDVLGHGVQEAAGLDGFAEGEAAGGQDDDGPGEVVEVLLGQDADAEEDDDGQDGDDAHVAERAFQLVRRAPEADRRQADDGHEPLQGGEALFDGADGHDVGALARLECHDQEQPDQQDRDDAHGYHNEEPLAPGRLRLHDAERHDVLRRRDRRQHSTNVGGERDAHDDGLGHIRVRREVTQHRLLMSVKMCRRKRHSQSTHFDDRKA